MNARTKAHAAELAAKQARADSDFARMRAHDVAPDFVQPGELKKVPEIVLDIDRMNTYAPQITPLPDNLTPNQFRKVPGVVDSLRPPNSLEYSWQHQQQPHSNTPPPQMLRANYQLSPNTYDNSNLLTPQRQYQQQTMEFPNHISSNQLMMKQHPSIDPNSRLKSYY